MTRDAYICHKAAGRFRIKVPQARNQQDVLAYLQQRIGKITGVQNIQANATTASLLIEHSTDVSAEDVMTRAQENGWLVSVEHHASVKTVNERLAVMIERADAGLVKASEGEIDFRSLLVILLGVFSFIQITRGQGLAPAASLLWYLFQLVPTNFNNRARQ